MLWNVVYTYTGICVGFLFKKVFPFRLSRMSYSEEYSEFTRDEEHRLYALRTRTCTTEGNPETVAELVRDPDFTVSEEGLTRLSEGERQELMLLTGKHRAFMAEARFRMAMGENAKMNTESEDLMAERLTKLKRGVMFWGSLVATAAPGVVGRQLGMTPEFSHWNWITDKVILGAIPIVSQIGSSGNHLELIRQHCQERKINIGLVVSALTLDELDGFGVDVCTFAKTEHWRTTLGVKEFEQIQVPDFGADTDYQSIYKAVTHIHDVVTRGDAVYVHCKAGKGRSWMVVTCFLTTTRVSRSKLRSN